MQGALIGISEDGVILDCGPDELFVAFDMFLPCMMRNLAGAAKNSNGPMWSDGFSVSVNAGHASIHIMGR